MMQVLRSSVLCTSDSLRPGSIYQRFGLAAGLTVAIAMTCGAGGQESQHGRKWKPLPPTAHIVVTVVKGFDGKPLPNAAVVFHAVRDGRDDGNLEVKTDPDGKATIDVIEIGSQVNIQVIADGFATAAQDMNVNGPTEILEMKLLRPRAQISMYTDNDGEAAKVKPGTQEHIVPKTPPQTPQHPSLQASPTQLPGPLNAPPGTVTIPTQPGAPVPEVPPVAPPPTGAPITPGTPQ